MARDLITETRYIDALRLLDRVATVAAEVVNDPADTLARVKLAGIIGLYESSDAHDVVTTVLYDERGQLAEPEAHGFAEPIDPDWPGEEGYANRGDAGSWAPAA